MSGDEKKPDLERAPRFLPFSLEQNPAPVPLVGQDGQNQFQDLTDSIMATFLAVLPSNYVAQINGPYYTTQFRAMAEQLARIQITSEEASLDSYIDFTRPEFLWQTVGTLVFPEADTQSEAPVIEGDVSYRTFLKRMIELLLTGATLKVQEAGVALLTTAVVTILEKVAFSRDPNTAWGFPEQFEFEINVSDCAVWTDPGTGVLITGNLGSGFAPLPITTAQNVNLVLRALKPAHTLYEYRNLFLDTVNSFEDSVSWDFNSYYYDDLRKFCTGSKEINGTKGVTLTDRFLFSDATLAFGSVCPGAILEILSGPNARVTLGGKDAATLGRYRVRDILRMPVGAESTPRAYTTSPTGLTGTATILDGGQLEDLSQDWSLADEGEILTLSAGPNAGSYRLETLLGADGGPVGFVASGSLITSVRVAPSLLRLETIQPETATNQTYRVAVDRLGVRTPQVVSMEDVSDQFYL